MNPTRHLKRGLVAPLLVIACLVPITNAGAARLEAGGCSRYAKPTVKTTYDAERIKVVAHFTKCLEDGEPTLVSAGLSRGSSLEGAAAVRVVAQTCDRSWPCKLVVRMPHPDVELAEYEFVASWTGLNGREQTLDSGPTWCTSSPLLSQCIETLGGGSNQP